MTQPDTAVEAPDLFVDETESPEGLVTPVEETDAAESPLDTSPEYVRRLRTEAADARVKLQRLNEFETALFDAVAGNEASKILRDPTDFTPTDRAALLDEDGYPDRDKISAAVSALVDAKPYLARVAGDVGMGARPGAEETVSLGGLLRNAAR